MKLSSFRIRNYKAIKDSGECDLSLESITILAGQNESGKTSILEALRDFDFPAAMSAQAQPDDNEDAIPSVECTFAFTGQDDLRDLEGNDKQAYELSPDAIGALLKHGRVTIRKTSPRAYSLVDNVVLGILAKHPVVMVGETSEESSEASEGSDDTSGSSEASSTDENSDTEESAETTIALLASEKVSGEIALALVRRTPYMVYFDSFDGHLPRQKYLSDIDKKDQAGYRAVQDFIELADIDVSRLSSTTDAKKLGNYLESKSATVTGEFLSYWSQKYDGENQVEIVTELHRDDKGPYLSFYVKDGGVRKYPDQRSKGFLWFLSFYLRLNAEKAETEELGAVVLIDEPGSYLHPRAQRDILKVLEEKIAKANSQVIFSTHSSDLIDSEHINRVRLVLNRKEKGTAIHKLTDSAVRANGDTEFNDALSPVIAAIGKDLSRDFSVVAKKNVLVEGISDFYYLTTLRDKSAFKIPNDIRIIPMTGALSISHMVSIMIGWGLEYAVVMDRDDISNAEYEKLVDELDVPVAKVFRIEGGKAIEDLFTEKDFKKYVLDDESAVLPPNKHKSDIVKNQKVILSRQFREKYKETTLTLEPQSKANFSKIMDFIQKSF